MPIRGSVTSAQGAASSASLAKPTGVIDGDAVLIHVVARLSSGAPTISGFTQLGTKTGSGGFGLNAWVFGRVASSDPTNYTVTFPGTTNHIVQAIAFYEQKASPFGSVATGDGLAADTNHTVPAVTVDFANSTVLSFFGSAITTVTPITDTLASWTERSDLDFDTGADIHINAHIADRTFGVGSTGTSTLVSNQQVCGVTIAVELFPNIPLTGTIASATSILSGTFLKSGELGGSIVSASSVLSATSVVGVVALTGVVDSS